MSSDTTKWFTKKRKIAGGLLFATFVFASHVLLPLLDQSDIYPFSTWQLFDGVPCKGCYFDLDLAVGDSTMHLSDYKGFNDRYVFNFLIQRLGRTQCQDEGLKKNLTARLVARGVRPLAVTRINIFTSDYALLSPEEKSAHNEIVCRL